MPELPDIVVLARSMDAALRGKVIADVVANQPKCLNVEPEALREGVAGRRLERFWPRGKWVLAAFDENERRALTGFGEFVSYPAEKIVIREGESQNCLYFLLKGVVHALHKVKGGTTPVGAIREGEWFGEVNIFDPDRASAMVVARTDARMWRISRSRLEEFLNAHPPLGCMVLLGAAEVLARRTRALVTKLNATWELSW